MRHIKLWLLGVVNGLPAPPKLEDVKRYSAELNQAAVPDAKARRGAGRRSDAFADFFDAFGGDIYDLLGDADGDGALSEGEVKQQFGEDAMALQLTTAIDTSRDGSLDAEEIKAARRLLFGASIKPDRESYVSHLLFKELKRKQQTSKALAVAWTPQEISTILKTFDTNNDGTIQTIEMMAHKDTLRLLRGDKKASSHASDRSDAETDESSADISLENEDDDDEEGGVVARFVRTFFFGYLTPAADLRRMWSVYRNLSCSCLDVEADTENIFWLPRAPCLVDGDLERLFKNQETRCDFAENATLITRRDYKAIISFGAPSGGLEAAAAEIRYPSNKSSSHQVNHSTTETQCETNDPDLDEVVLSFEDFRHMLQIQAPTEIAGAVSHLIHGGQLDVARTLLIRQVADLLSNPAASTSSKLAGLLARDLNWTPPVAPVNTGSGVPWNKVLRDRELATLKAWLVPTACVLIVIAICAYVAALLAKLDAMVRDYDQIRAYFIGYLESKHRATHSLSFDSSDAHTISKTSSPQARHSVKLSRSHNTPLNQRDPILDFLTELSFDRGGLLPARYGLRSDIGRAAYSAGAALAKMQDDGDRRALGASEIAAILKQARNSNGPFAAGNYAESNSTFITSPHSPTLLSDGDGSSSSSPHLRHIQYHRQRGESFSSSGGL